MSVRERGSALTFRRATPADLEAVESLLRSSDLPLAGVAASIGNMIVAESAGAVAGVIGLEIHGAHGLLRSAAVSHEWQGKGVGHALVERLIDDVAERGLESLYLLTTTAEDYFPRFGFVRVERDTVPTELLASEEFRGACPSSAAVMRREARSPDRSRPLVAGS